MSYATVRHVVRRPPLRLIHGGLGALGTADDQLAAQAHIPTSVLRAIRSVESGGHPNAIRFEPRIFNMVTSNRYQSQFPTTTGSSGTGSSLPSAFNRAYQLDPRNAINATSWGLYQVLLRDAGPQIWSDAGGDPARFISMFNASPQDISDQILVSWFANKPAAAAAARAPNFPQLARLYNGSSTSPWGARVAAAYERMGGTNAVPALVQATAAVALPWLAAGSAGLIAIVVMNHYAQQRNRKKAA